MDTPTSFHPVVVGSRLGAFDGYANGNVAYFDREDAQAGKVVRHFVLLEESVKLMFEPWGLENEWYVDIVRIHWSTRSELILTDLYLDVIVEGRGPVYRAIDLDDLADAIQRPTIDLSDAAFALRTLQRFLDSHIHRTNDFPPKCIRQLLPETAQDTPGPQVGR